MNPAADHRVDVDVKIGVLGQNLELFVEHLKALLRNVVRLDVIDRNLQMIKPGFVQALDALGGQQVAVSDHARHESAAAHDADHIVELRMQQRLAARKRQDA